MESQHGDTMCPPWVDSYLAFGHGASIGQFAIPRNTNIITVSPVGQELSVVTGLFVRDQINKLYGAGHTLFESGDRSHVMTSKGKQLLWETEDIMVEDRLDGDIIRFRNHNLETHHTPYMNNILLQFVGPDCVLERTHGSLPPPSHSTQVCSMDCLGRSPTTNQLAPKFQVVKEAPRGMAMSMGPREEVRDITLENLVRLLRAERSPKDNLTLIVIACRGNMLPSQDPGGTGRRIYAMENRIVEDTADAHSRPPSPGSDPDPIVWDGPLTRTNYMGGRRGTRRRLNKKSRRRKRAKRTRRRKRK